MRAASTEMYVLLAFFLKEILTTGEGRASLTYGRRKFSAEPDDYDSVELRAASGSDFVV